MSRPRLMRAITQCAEARRRWPETSMLWPHVGFLSRFHRGGRGPMLVRHPGAMPSLDLRRVQAYRSGER